MKTRFSFIDLTLPTVAQRIIVTHYDVNTLESEDLLILPHYQTLVRAVPQRKAEHLAGRLAAREALRGLNCEARLLAVGSHRQPLWPEGIIGSISHTASLALAAVAKDSGRLCGLGIDIESVLSSKQTEEVIDGVIQREEYGLLRQATLSVEEALTIIFSAKESLFKALFRHVGEYFEFSAAHITMLSPQTQRFTLQLVQPLTATLPAGMTFNGQWHYLDGKIVTLIRF